MKEEYLTLIARGASGEIVRQDSLRVLGLETPRFRFLSVRG
jgi:hypothetical protein